LSSLPIHAAGIYDGPNQDNIGNYFVSSYTPTLTALYRLITKTAKQDHLKPIQTPSNVLLVAQADVPDQPLLPQAQVEIDLVRSLLLPSCMADSSTVSGMSVDTAIKGVSGADVVHFACHGHQDQENPLKSGFELKDGRLTLGQLMQLEIPHAQLAYLSACESAGMDESRPDENLNLVGAMILVGFKSVIGTMW
jgi:CHAT domain-containing protein